MSSLTAQSVAAVGGLPGAAAPLADGRDGARRPGDGGPGTPERPFAAAGSVKGLLFDLSGIDPKQVLMTREDLEVINPHRGHMGMLDAIIWRAHDFKRGIAKRHTRHDEFWVAGHYPGKPMFPGVLMIEAGAQLAVYLYNARLPEPMLAAFTRIENAVFRAPVVPGDDLYILCQEIKWSRRGFTCDVQGLVNGEKMAFEARVQGLAIQIQG